MNRAVLKNSIARSAIGIKGDRVRDDAAPSPRPSLLPNAPPYPATQLTIWWSRFGIRERKLRRSRRLSGTAKDTRQWSSGDCLRTTLPYHFSLLYFISHRTALTKVSATRLLRFLMFDVSTRLTLVIFFNILLIVLLCILQHKPATPKRFKKVVVSLGQTCWVPVHCCRLHVR